MNKSNKKESRRQRLGYLVGSGKLRYALENDRECNDDEVINLIVDVCGRYCEPKRRRR